MKDMQIEERKELIRQHNDLLKKDPRSKNINNFYYLSEQVATGQVFDTELDIISSKIHRLENKINKRECHCNICEFN